MRQYILVTGGAGYIGSHMVKLLEQAGENVLVIDNFSNGAPASIRPQQLVRGDIGDRQLLTEVFSSHRIKAVMHFAASIEVEQSMLFPGPFMENNVDKTKVLLDAMVRFGVGQLIFSSTAAVYGMSHTARLQESAEKNPINPYGVTKLMAEQLIEGYCRMFGMRSILFRYFNAAGADPDGELGECHEPETHLIPLVLQAASGRRESISIYGCDYPTRDGTCIRDYVHVMDICNAHYLGLKALEDGAPSRVYNLGSQHGHSVREVIDAAWRVTGKQFEVNVAGRRPGDSPSLIADSSLAERGLGWRAQYAGLDTIVRHAWRWEQTLAQRTASRGAEKDRKVTRLSGTYSR